MKQRKSWTTYLILQVLVIQIVNTSGIKITYKSAECHRCKSEELYFVKLVQFPLQDCVEECAKRNLCKALRYFRRFGLCELQESVDDSADGQCRAPAKDEQCTYIRREDINIYEEPDICSTCKDGQVCDWNINQCIYLECPRRLDDVIVQGNMNSLGSRIKYTCKPGYEKMDRNSFYSVCNGSGEWDPQPRCLQNFALHKTADMVSVFDVSWGNANKGVDGGISQTLKTDATNSCFHTGHLEKPWWQVDLGGVYKILMVRIFNVVDDSEAQRANRAVNVVLAVGNHSGIFKDIAYKPGQIKPIDEFMLDPEISAQFVKLWLNTTNSLVLCEVQVLGT